MNDPLLTVMCRRWLLLVLLVAAAVPGAVFLVRVIPPTYSVTNSIRLGRFMGVPLELPEFTKQRFKMVGFLADAYEAAALDLDVSTDDLPRGVAVDIENDLNKTDGVDTLRFSTRADNPKTALAMSRALTAHLMRLHGAKLAEARRIRDVEIKAWDEAITETRGGIAEMEQRLESAGKGELDDAALYVVSAKLQERRNILFNMMQMRHAVTLKNGNPVESYNTEPAGAVRLPERPKFPRLSLVLPALMVVAFMVWLAWCRMEAAWPSLAPHMRPARV